MLLASITRLDHLRLGRPWICVYMHDFKKVSFFLDASALIYSFLSENSTSKGYHWTSGFQMGFLTSVNLKHQDIAHPPFVHCHWWCRILAAGCANTIPTDWLSPPSSHQEALSTEAGDVGKFYCPSWSLCDLPLGLHPDPQDKKEPWRGEAHTAHRQQMKCVKIKKKSPHQQTRVWKYL